MGLRHHRLVRFLSLVAIVAALTYAFQRSGFRTDVTSEGLSRLTPGTEELIASIGPERPVTVHAFVSEEVPRDYVTVRSRLLNILREMEARGGEGLRVRIVEPRPFSPEAEEAIDRYGIYPQELAEREGGQLDVMPVFMGLAFVSGANEEVVPFLSRGLSAEYEVARALRVVMQDKKKVVGILRTDATIMGNFDLQTRSQQPAWMIVEELKKQYEVRSLNPNAAIPEDVDVLFVPQIASLTQGELDKVREYVDAGRPALLTADPFPTFGIKLSPREEKPAPAGQGGMFGQGAPPSEPKGDYVGLLKDIGVEWPDDEVVYDTYNPHPSFGHVPPQVVFVGKRDDGTDPFAEGADPVVKGLEEVVLLFSGELRPASGATTQFTPLLSTGRSAGYALYDDMVEKHPLFGPSPVLPPAKQSPVTGKNMVLAARVTGGGGPAPAEGQPEIKPRNVVVIADLDLFHDQFFALRDRGGDVDGDGLVDVRFDNVTFLLNVVDSLAGDDRFIELRKRTPAFRRLTWIDEQTKTARDTLESERQKALDAAETELENAQKALDEKVAAIKARTDLDEQSKAIQARAAEMAESRRLEAKKADIDRDKERAIQKVETEHQREVEKVRDQVRVLAVALPPLPAILLGLVIFGRKRRREQETIPTYRRAKAR
jgi:ABC-2 type transport system permease protein